MLGIGSYPRRRRPGPNPNNYLAIDRKKDTLCLDDADLTRALSIEFDDYRWGIMRSSGSRRV